MCIALPMSDAALPFAVGAQEPAGSEMLTAL